MQQHLQQPHGSAGLGEVGQGGWGEDGDPERSQATAASLCPTAGVNIGGAGSYIYEKPQIEGQTAPGPIEHPVKVEERKVNAAPPKGPSKGEGQGRMSSLALPPWRSAGPELLRLGMVWDAGCVRGVLCPHVSWLRLSLCFPCPLSFQPPASPPSPGSPTCARAAARESTLVRWPAGSGCLPWDGMAPWCWGSMQDPGACRGDGRGFWLRDGVGGTEGCAQGACRDGSSWRSSWVRGLICIVSPAVISRVGGVGLIAVLGQPPSPARQQRGGRDAGGWDAQGCLGILYAEVVSPQGMLPLGTCTGGPA